MKAKESGFIVAIAISTTASTRFFRSSLSLSTRYPQTSVWFLTVSDGTHH